MFIRRFLGLRKDHTTIFAETSSSKDKVPNPAPRSLQHATIDRRRENWVMGNCTSFLNTSFGTSNQKRVVENNTVQTLSTEVLIQNEQSSTTSEISGSELEERIRDGLWGLMKRSSDRENSQIILPDELAKFWNPVAKRNFYTRQSWYDTAWDEDNRMLDYQKIISILILARFREWDRFREIFIDKGRTDKELLFTLDHLEKDDFLGPRDAPYFFRDQWIFCPLVIEEKQQSYELIELEAERRFPYIEIGKEIGSGATGTVTRQVIAAHHLKYSKPRESENIQPKTVACKCVVEKSVETVEFDNLKTLRGFLSKHDRIMVNIATIIRNSSSAGRVHFILYDLAAYDLNTLLNKRPEKWEEERDIRHDSAHPRRNNSHEWWAGDLIKESQNLADALDFLHHRLYNKGNWSLVHNDLKPENILVFYPDSEDPDEQYPVGQWKIADFGLSRIKEKQEKQKEHPVDGQQAACTPNSPRSLLPVTDKLDALKLGVDVTHRRNRSTSARDISFSTAKRDPGRYTAPEIEGEGAHQQHPKSGDVWALGCILSEVLAYAVAPHLVGELRAECEKPHNVDQRFYDVNNKEAKVTVMAWLRELPNRYQVRPSTPCNGQTPHPSNPSWVAGCVKLIESALVVNPTERCTAGSIRDRLGRIQKQMSRDHKFTLVERPESGSGSPTIREYQNEEGTAWLSVESFGSPKNMEPPKW